ncbi:MAG: hypothetical protein J6R98_02735 [Bacteroidaceae bacterium]|nr:hypothetical protein [Bacteroidaceae bacterium]
MNIRKITRLLPLALLVACSGQADIDRAASRMLDDARFALRHGHYTEARDSILSLRVKYPTAIEARKQGILLLDSIELKAAQDSLKNATGEEWKRLDMKAKFFERKLREDLSYE